MKNIIVAYTKRETAMQLRNVLDDNGLYVSHICGTGASVLGIAAEMRSGIIVTSYLLSDMNATELAERLPSGFDIVALSNKGRESYMGNLTTLPLPIDKEEFIRTIEILVATDNSFTSRNQSESQLISNAKTILMKAQGITEMQAHKYLQKESMKSGKKMTDVAKDIISSFS